jgi:hypothetical protein
MTTSRFASLHASILFALSVVGGANADGITYTWTGSVDLDWNNTANWVGGIVPVDDTPLSGTLEFPEDGSTTDRVSFEGSAMPSNFPGVATSRNTPGLILKSGGTLTASIPGGFWTSPANSTRTAFQVGDGVGTATDATGVIFNLTTAPLSPSGLLNRDQSGGTHNYIINSDGVWNITGGLQANNGSDRWAALYIAGGEVNVSGIINDFYAKSPNNFIDFTSEGGTLTAAYGGEVADFAAAEAAIGSLFQTSDPEVTLRAIDNTDTFTIEAFIPPPAGTVIYLR